MISINPKAFWTSKTVQKCLGCTKVGATMVKLFNCYPTLKKTLSSIKAINKRQSTLPFVFIGFIYTHLNNTQFGGMRAPPQLRYKHILVRPKASQFNSVFVKLTFCNDGLCLKLWTDSFKFLRHWKQKFFWLIRKSFLKVFYCRKSHKMFMSPVGSCNTERLQTHLHTETYK